MGFNEVIGQEEAKQQFMKLVAEQRVPHAMLLCGPMGCGKMALAIAFASFLLGERDGSDPLQSEAVRVLPELTPDKKRNAEAMLAKLAHPDLLFSYPVIRPAGTSTDHKMESDDFAKEWNQMVVNSPYFSMDQWLAAMDAGNQQAKIGVGESDSLIRKLSMKSSQGGYKVCIIWLPERMNGECANSLLKLIEEPPSQTVFIMVCEEPERLLETIRSRTQRFDIKKIDTPTLEKALVDKRFIAEEVSPMAIGSQR